MDVYKKILKLSIKTYKELRKIAKTKHTEHACTSKIYNYFLSPTYV